MQLNPARIAIIDDDPFVMEHLAQTFRQRLSNVEVVGISATMFTSSIAISAETTAVRTWCSG
jgi:DNA-binding NarL/FixJ family response regulator